MPTTAPPPDPQRTLAVMCGASDWPRLGEHFVSSEAFAATAARLRRYLVSDAGMGLSNDRLLDLFDDERHPADQLERIDEFLRAQFSRMGAEDGANATVLFTYIGHGAFALPPHREYCLLVRGTRPHVLEVTSLRVRDLQRTLREVAASSARLFVLDSCFAGAALEAFQGGEIAQAESAKIEELLEEEPSTGVAMLCAASKRNPARIGGEYTVFGAALLDTLENGDPHVLGPMSLERVCELVRQRVKKVENAPLPETHDPDQPGLKVSARPFFPNRASPIAAEDIAIREGQTRHDLTAAVAASRFKRQLTQQNTAISAHDLVTEEFTRLHQRPEFALTDYNNFDAGHFEQLLGRVIEATQVPVAAVAVLAYWGDPDTDRWWTPDLQRLARPNRHSGSTWLINLPLVAASMLFYAAGVAAIAAQKYTRLAQLLAVHGEPINIAGPVPISVMLVPNHSMMGLTTTRHYNAVKPTLIKALGIGANTIDDAWQRFEILRLATQLVAANKFTAAAGNYAAANRRANATSSVDPTAHAQANKTRNDILDDLAAHCPAVGLHLLAADRSYAAGSYPRWGSPIAERLAAEISRERDLHPLVSGLNISAEQIELALKTVSRAIGQAAQTHPANWPQGDWLPDEIWLDSTH